jgi:hypothetical protein
MNRKILYVMAVAMIASVVFIACGQAAEETEVITEVIEEQAMEGVVGSIISDEVFAKALAERIEFLYYCSSNRYRPEIISPDGKRVCKLDIKFKDDNDNRMIALTINTDWSVRVKGTLRIYLEDETVITCTDRNNYDVAGVFGNNWGYTTYYNLTEQDIN